MSNLLLRSLTPTTLFTTRAATAQAFQIPVALKGLESYSNILAPVSSYPLTLEAYKTFTPTETNTYRASKERFQKTSQALKTDLSDPAAIKCLKLRINLHQISMANQFWDAFLDTEGKPVSAIHALLSYYDSYVRTDNYLHDTVLRSLVLNRPSAITPELEDSDAALETLLRIERFLYADHRLSSGKGAAIYCVGGVKFSEMVTTPADLPKFQIPVLAQNGLFKVSTEDVSSQFHHVVVQCLPEPDGSQAYGTALLQQHGRRFSDRPLVILREMKPQVPPTLWEKVRDTFLKYWGYWLTFWLLFWFVDEEVITIVSLLVSKFLAMRAMRKELEESGGGKLYIATRSIG
eukprot:PhF_6_TR9430/c0_g1_i1/m.14741